KVCHEVVRVELLVAKELEYTPVKFVGTASDCSVDRITSRPPVLGGEVVRLYLELLNGVDGRDVSDPVAAYVAAEVSDVFIHAVEKMVVGRVTAPSGNEGNVGIEALEGSCATGEQAENKRIAAVERQIHDPFVLDDLAERRALRLEQRSGRV